MCYLHFVIPDGVILLQVMLDILISTGAALLFGILVHLIVATVSLVFVEYISQYTIYCVSYVSIYDNYIYIYIYMYL